MGNYRRKYAQEHGLDQTSQFFDADPEVLLALSPFSRHVQRVRMRDEISKVVLDDLIVWLKQGGHIGIHDATNSTKRRRSVPSHSPHSPHLHPRKLIVDRVSSEPGMSVMFLESICTDSDMIQANIRLKFDSPDYRNMERAQALKDFMERMHNYELRYQTVGGADEDHYSYLQVQDALYHITELVFMKAW